MKSSNPWKLIIFAMLVAILTTAPLAIADDIDPDADIPDISTMTDTTPVNPVLEIPQQCDQDSVAVLCDRSADDSSPSADVDAAAPNADADDSGDVASNPSDVGSVYDYANQNITNEASAMGTTSVPLGVAVPGYPVLSPGPVVVSSAPLMGPGSYPQWDRGTRRVSAMGGRSGQLSITGSRTWVHCTKAVRLSSIRRRGRFRDAFVRRRSLRSPINPCSSPSTSATIRRCSASMRATA